MLEHEAAEIAEGQAGVEDVFDEDDVLAFDGVVDVLDELDGLLRLVQGHRELSTVQLESRERRDVLDERGQLVGDRRSIRQEQGFKMWFDEQIRRCQ